MDNQIISAPIAARNTKKDYIIVSLIGLFFGLLLLPILKNIKLPFFSLNSKTVLILVIFFIIFANFALFIAFLIGRKIPVILQFAQFGAVGSLVTLLDLGTLNTLILLTGLARGFAYGVFKGISFLAASIVSYFLNRYWTFDASGSANVKEFGQFLVVSLIGLFLNVAVASIVVNWIAHPAIFTPGRWANIGGLAATAIALFWNFLGYKFIVFKK